MRSYYEARVPHHDTYMSWEGVDEMERLLGPIIDLFQDDIQGRDVLEVACGTGNWTQVLSRRARHVVATDLIEGYLEVARVKAAHLDNVDFLMADAYDLKALGSTFDAAFAADWWSHIPHSMVEAFLASLGSVLQPGARVVVVDMLRTQGFELAFHRIDAEGNEVQLRTLPDSGPFEVVRNFPGEEELRGRLEGFAEDVEYVEHEGLGRWVLRYTVPR